MPANGPTAGPGDIAVDVLWTLDLGNSALKVALWPAAPNAGDSHGLRGDPRGPLARARFEEPEHCEALLAAWIEAEVTQRGLRLVGGALSGVAGPEVTRQVAAWARAASGADLLAPPPHSIVNTCTNPHTVGLDRLFAARAAAERVGGSAVVIDVGTAMTVDAVEWSGPGTGPARFLGGAIAPGPRLLARALGAAAQLPVVEPSTRAPALGKETVDALRAGIVHGLRGAADELARRVGQEAGLAGVPRVLTGGALAYLLEPTPFWSGTLIVEPDLVHRGLLAALEDTRV